VCVRGGGRRPVPVIDDDLTSTTLERLATLVTEPMERGVNYNDWLAVLSVLRLVLVLLIHAEGGGESEEGGREGGAT
jgi:hypothetical protein